MLRLSVMFAFLVAAAPAKAEPSRLQGEQLKTTLAGAKLEFLSPIGVTVPVQFGHDGMVAGETSALAAVLGAAKDRGRWWVVDDKLCSKWFRWFEAEMRCATVSRDGDKLFFTTDDGQEGSATITVQAEPHSAPRMAQEIAAKPPPPPSDRAAELAAKFSAPAPASSPTTALETLAALAVPTAAAAATPPPSPTAKLAKLQPDVPAPRAIPPTATTRDLPRQQAGKPSAATTPAVGKVKPKMMEKAAGSKGKAPAPPPNKVANFVKQPVGNAAPAARDAAPIQSFRVVGVEEDDILNVRDGPSCDYDTIAEIAPDARGVTIIGACQAEWCPIRHGQAAGWVNTYYLAEETTEGRAANGQSQPVRAR